jgi:hypothetical protein
MRFYKNFHKIAYSIEYLQTIMKVRRVADLFLQLDLLHKRIDLQWLLAHVLTLAIAASWAVWGGGSGHLAVRLLYVVLFMGIAKLLLSRLGASRLSSTLLVSTLLILGWDFSAKELLLVDVYALVALMIQEYFLLKTKLAALIVMAISGIFIAGTGVHAWALLVLFVLIMIARVLWHAVIERMSKKAFVLFAVKAVCMAAFTPFIYFGIRETFHFSYGLPASLPTVSIPVWGWIVVAILTLRGFWATMLLKTDRSPDARPFRLFYIGFGGFILALVWLVEKYGDRIFLPNALSTLHSYGLTEFGISSGLYALFAVSLLVTAGVDRTLYKDTALARKITKGLSGSPLSE